MRCLNPKNPLDLSMGSTSNELHNQSPELLCNLMEQEQVEIEKAVEIATELARSEGRNLTKAEEALLAKRTR